MPQTLTSLCNLGSSGASLGDIGTVVPIVTSIALNSRAEVFEKRPVKDGFGGHPISYVSLGTIDCRLEVVTKDEERVEGSALVGVTTWKCIWLIDASPMPKAAHRLLISGFAYEVTETDQGLTDGTHVTAQLMRIGRRVN